jgi:hypothetical protein
MSIYASEVPAPQSRYMPKKQGALARRILDAAWQRHQDTQFPQAERDRVGEIIASELERRNPVADMDVLERYGLTEIEGAPIFERKYRDGFGAGYDEIPTGNRRSVHVYVTDQHGGGSTNCGVDIPRSVRVAKNSERLWANCIRFSEQPDLGLNDKARAEMAESGELETYLADHRAREARMLPREVDPFFARIMDLRKAHREHYQQFNHWLDAHRGDKYPTWAEIADRFPFIGEYLAEIRAAQAEAA